MVTASWNQFVTRSLHFVRSAKQSSGAAAAAAAVGENGAEASGALKTFFFSKWEQAGRQQPHSNFLHGCCQTTCERKLSPRESFVHARHQDCTVKVGSRLLASPDPHHRGTKEQTANTFLQTFTTCVCAGALRGVQVDGWEFLARRTGIAGTVLS